MKTIKIFFIISILFLVVVKVSYPQQLPKSEINRYANDTLNTKEQLTQYRRGVGLQNGYQTYEQKYQESQ